MQKIVKTEYSDVMRTSFINYAMSVIISRAIPDVRDGLKPVQRRTLYDMYELGIRYDRPYRKSARIVGDTMGKYHPHGDSSIYDALVVMAQGFKKSLPLVDGHGNFGSIEGDGAAAMRYTEARLEKITQLAFLNDLDKNVIDFVPNFDETEKEPSVLPVRIPNLLVNGSEGIAVGMATNIPPHNLGEVIDAAVAFMKNPCMSIRDIMQYVKGPDFPTGAIVTNQDELEEIYTTGTGKIKIRGKLHVEKGKQGKSQIVITEIPYPMIGANIGRFMNEVYGLVETKKTTDIVDIINQSSSDGIRIVIELKKNADVEYIENLLYKKTRLESTFGVNMLAVVNGCPKTLSLLEILQEFSAFQMELAERKYRHLLDREMSEKEIQEGLIHACDVIDVIIEAIRGSRSRDQVRQCLVSGVVKDIKFKTLAARRTAAAFRFTERQANAILEMRLYKLIGLEIDALRAEYNETLKKIARYLDILNNRDVMIRVLTEELLAWKQEFATPRKTLITNLEDAVLKEKPVEEIPVVFLMDRFGYAKTVDASVYEKNMANANAENKYIFPMMNTDRVCIFTNTGKMHQCKALDLPYGKFRDKGVPVDNLSNYDSKTEQIVFVCPLSELKQSNVLFVTKQAMAKYVEGASFDAAKKTIAATGLNEDDELIFVGFLSGKEHLVLQSKNGYFLRISVSEIPEKKKTAKGVRAMKLDAKDTLSNAYLLFDKDIVVHYKDTDIHINRLKISKRDTKGVKR